MIAILSGFLSGCAERAVTRQPAVPRNIKMRSVRKRTSKHQCSFGFIRAKIKIMLIAKSVTRGPAVQPKFKQKIIRKIIKFVAGGRRPQPRPVQQIAEHIGLPESVASAYMDMLTTQQFRVHRTRESDMEGAHICFLSRDGIDGYVVERDKQDSNTV
jgi:hypothetical protein